MSTNLLLSGHEAQVLTLSFNRDSSMLASAGLDRKIMLWSPKSNYDNVSVLRGHTNAITCLSWTHADRLVTGSADKTLSTWDLETSKISRKFKGHRCIIHDLSTPTKTLQLLASVADDGCLKIWDPRRKGEVRSLQSKYPLTSVAFSYNGDRVYTGGIDNDIRVWNLGEQKVEEVIEGHGDTVSSLSISFDGSYLMSNSFDETIRIWDIRPSSSQRLKKTLSGHAQGNEKGLLRGGWSKDGLYVCCGSVDRCVYIWDTATRKIVQRLGGHKGTINHCAMGDGNWLASGSNDHNIIVSQLPQIFL